jgi:glycosyltransferase involved in cell wall biosynthesis
MKKRIALIITRMVPGGASRIVADLLNHGKEQFNMTLVTGGDDLPNDLQERLPGISVTVLPELVRDISPLSDFRCYFKLKALFKNEHFDIVHTHSSKAGFLGRLAAKKSKIPFIIHTPHGTIHLPGSKIPGIPKSAIVQRILLYSERYAGRNTDILTTLTKAEKEHCTELRLSNSANTIVVYNGIDLKAYAHSPERRKSIRQQFEIDDSDLLLFSAGRLTTEKGHLYLVRSFKEIAEEFPHTKLIIAGDGREKDIMAKEASELIGNGRLMFPGFMQDIPGMLSAADIFVLPSLYEGFGLAALEAMAAGLPVIASDVGGLPELINAGKDGYLFNSTDTNDLSTKIRKLLASAELRRELGERAKLRSEDFRLNKMLNSYFSLYSSSD